MITQEQIEANITATHLRRQQQREEQLRRNAEDRGRRNAEENRRAFPEYDGKLIGFIVKTRHEKFKPLIGRVMSMAGEDDALIHVVGEQPPQETLEVAVALFAPDRDKLHLVLEKPVPTHGLMGHWLKPMLASQEVT